MRKARAPHISRLLEDALYIEGRGRIIARLCTGEIDEAEASRLCTMLALTQLSGFGGGGRFLPRVTVLTTTGGANWPVPSNFNKSNNTVEGLGTGSKGSPGQA